MRFFKNVLSNSSTYRLYQKFSWQHLGGNLYAYRQRYSEKVTANDIHDLFIHQTANMKELTFYPGYTIWGFLRNSFSKETHRALKEELEKYKDGPLAILELSECYKNEDLLIELLEVIIKNETLSNQMTLIDLSNSHLTEKTLDFIKNTFIPECPDINAC